MKKVEAESLGAVHTHTHTQYIQRMRKEAAKKFVKTKLENEQ